MSTFAGLREAGRYIVATVVHKLDRHSEMGLYVIGFDQVRCMSNKCWLIMRTLFSAGLIYIIDSNDMERIQESREELDALLEADELKDVPLLVLANKQDLPQAESLPKIVEGLGLRKLNRQWHIQGCCAVNGDGILDGMLKFADMIKLYKKNHSW